MRQVFPELPLYVIAEFPPAEGGVRWIPYRRHSFRENWERCRAALRGKSIRLAGVLLVPGVPFRRMRLLALLLAPLQFLAINENFNEFLLLRPRSLPTLARHLVWRSGNLLRWYFGADGILRRRELHRRPVAEAARQDERSSITIHSGRGPSGKPRVLIASAYVPFPLAHGGAVRMDNLTRRAAAEFDQILVAFTENDDPPARELLDRFVEVVLVRRHGSHDIPAGKNPLVVEQFASAAFRGALRYSIANWKPEVAQLEFTQMAQYAADCAPARTILVEHDITFDLYEQLARLDDDWDLRREVDKWRKFETAAWRELDCVVAMSGRDQAIIDGAQSGASSTMLPNGVDLERFRPPEGAPEPGRLLFVGSFSHLPNLLAANFFLTEVWPRLRGARLHIIAGARHDYYLEYQRQRVSLKPDQPGVELEGFVADVRPAYARASVVVAPLVASAGTNLKILEAMACGRPVVSTPEGVHGLDITPGEGFLLVRGAEEMAAAIEGLLGDAEECRRIAATGRRVVEERYGWDGIAARQAELYRALAGQKRSGRRLLAGP